jgi:AcrR family transcriptional regulator
VAAGARTSTTSLSRDRIVDAAIALVERDGLAAFSMRRLASELDAGTMSLYNHVTDKNDLFDAIAARVAGEVHLSEGGDWQTVVRSWATESRRVLLDHRSLIPIVIAPERFEHIGRAGLVVLERLQSLGLSEADALRVVRVVARYFSGTILFDAPWGREATSPRRELDATFGSGLDALLSGLEQQLS